jgi:hypothetical protein
MKERKELRTESTKEITDTEPASSPAPVEDEELCSSDTEQA